MPYRYDKICALNHLFRTEYKDFPLTEEYWNKILALSARSSNGIAEDALALCYEGSNQTVAHIVTVARNHADQEFIMVIFDDYGHTHILKDQQSINNFVQDNERKLFVCAPSPFNKKLSRVMKKYTNPGRSQSLNAIAMAIRLTELGEGDQ
jgi:hypothetical protein